MSLTSYRAAPPRGMGVGMGEGSGGPGGDLLFRRLSGSTIGAEGFHGRVRDGIGCLAPRHGHQAVQAPRNGQGELCVSLSVFGVGRRVRDLPLHAGGGKRVERLVPVSCAGCPASTSGLSTWWSATALNETWF